jgi:hypothetical protein
VWVLLAVTTCGLLLLQSPPKAAADDEDPPTQVARLNYSQGTVSFQAAGEDEWVTAVPNRPLITGDTLWADEGSRAEVHVGSTAIRLNQGTEVTLLDLGDHVTQLRLAQGSMIIRIRHLDDDDSFEIDTPNLAFSPLRTGDYRIDVSSDGMETVTSVWQGRGEVNGGGQEYDVLAGQQIRFRGTGPLAFDIEQIGRRDNFADWCEQRDLREDRADAANYVSRDMTGYEDLDDYGRWQYVANYGPVWVPAGVPVGWAPYRFGHWIWVRPWGWTWVEDEPWGFAPFHYGRWAYVNNFWCWVPGPVVVRPVYAPALVAFVGGDGFHFAGGPGVAWFPLAPGDVYVPAYRASRVYINNVNTTNTVVNVTRITNVYNYYTTTNNVRVNRVTYVNQHVTNAVTVVSHDTFVNARPVWEHTLQASPREIEQASVAHVAPIAPVKASVVGAGKPARALPPAPVMNRQVVAMRPAPAPKRAPEREVVRPGWGNQRPPQPAQPENRPSEVTTTPPRGEMERGQPSSAMPARNPEAERARDTAQPAPQPHPLVKPAPPVEPKSPQQWQEQEQKNRVWQQQREQAPPPRTQPEQPRREERTH